MSQVIFDSIDPTMSGTTLATTLDNFKNAIVSGCSGTSRPTELGVGGSWVDTTNDPTSWSFKIWTGTVDVEIFTINLVSSVSSVALAVDTFLIKKITADTAGAIMELVKRRIANSGQVLTGDVVGEIRITGRTNSATNPVVGKLIWTATDDQTTSAYGGTLSLYSTPDATATLTEHFRLINGLFETVVPHKLNSQILVSQDIATSATIAALSAANVLAEMTGAIATDIQGINAAHDSKVITIHNRSSANVTLKHLNGSAAAANQIKLPSSLDYVIIPQSSATLFYCTTDTKWKLRSTSDKTSGYTVETFYGLTQSWTAPTGCTAVRVASYRLQKGGRTERSGMIDAYGNAYAWGIDTNGQLGIAGVTPRSSPIAVLGGLSFERIWGSTAAAMATYGIDKTGSAYAWGINTNGQLGDSTVIPKSTPVAVAGGLKFTNLAPRDASCFGIVTNGFAYAWGLNTNGQLGTGNVTPVSAPTLVLGGLKFAELWPTSGASSSAAVLGVTPAGVAYAWGINTNGNLGVGDVTVRSSPVAVLGSLTLKDIGGGAVSTRYFSLGLTTAGAAYGWGSNTLGQLGVGDVVARSSPVAVLGGLTFDRLVTHAKSETSMALTSAGALYAWGDNTKGVLGLGDILARSSPVAVLGGLTFSKVRLFKSVAMGITADGTMYAWGDNTNGQLGVGDVVARSSPVAVLGGLKFADVFFADGTTDIYSAFGITVDGLLYAWGINTNGTLGLGDVAARSSPVAVLGAFGPNAREDVTVLDLTVVAGTAYTITVGPGTASFGGAVIGRDVYKVEVEYLV